MIELSIPWTEIENAKSLPGIYAWYYTPPIGEADRDDPGGWSELVKEYVSDHRRPIMRVNAKATLGLEFEGQIDHSPFTGPNDEEWNPDVDSIELITDVIDSAIPNLSAPLYIGIAKKSLNTRLRRHKSDIERYQNEGIETVAEIRDEDPEREADRIFASRVVDRGIESDSLVVEALGVDAEEYDNLDEGLRSVEYIMNRIFFPILGRR
jgi:hypothetical protein